jgi:hypothetical protein
MLHWHLEANSHQLNLAVNLYKTTLEMLNTVESRLHVLEGRGDREDVGPSREGDSDEGEDAEDENAGGDENEESEEDDGEEGAESDDGNGEEGAGDSSDDEDEEEGLYA